MSPEDPVKMRSVNLKVFCTAQTGASTADSKHQLLSAVFRSLTQRQVNGVTLV